MNLKIGKNKTNIISFSHRKSTLVFTKVLYLYSSSFFLLISIPKQMKSIPAAVITTTGHHSCPVCARGGRVVTVVGGIVFGLVVVEEGDVEDVWSDAVVIVETTDVAVLVAAVVVDDEVSSGI